jgi:acyl transferase domain-containing protein
MSRSTVLLFSGQGSHYYQMGRELFEHDKPFRACMRELDSIVQDHGCRSVVRALYEEGRSKGDRLEDIEVTHPAIFMVELALARTLAARGMVPDSVVGTSLGAFVAAVVAGCLSAEAALVAVLQQARAIVANCGRGGMIAILDSPALFLDPALREVSELVAQNFDSHFVVAAPDACLAGIEAHLRARNVVSERLAVRYAFHSRWIDEAEHAYRRSLDNLRFERARIPMICCVQARTLSHLTADYFWEVARRQIRFQEAVAHLEEAGEHRYIDAGPSGTLATYLKHILGKEAGSRIQRVLSPFGQDLANLETLAGAPMGGS